MSGLSRVCFQLQVRPERIGEYRERHSAVWPDMLRALRDAGWRNYSLFLREDGLVIGYFETDDTERAFEAMRQTEIDALWQAEMAELFEDISGRDGEGFIRYAEVFNLENQLAALNEDGAHSS